MEFYCFTRAGMKQGFGRNWVPKLEFGNQNNSGPPNTPNDSKADGNFFFTVIWRI
jgi:hypothetical protein